MNDVGNIAATTHEDGSFWEYAYDGRYRLTGAVRKNASETIEAAYAYTYDDGDNLLTKVEPFEDDFNDGNYTSWLVGGGSWQATNNYLEPTHTTSWNFIRQSTTDADNEVRLRYRINDTSNGTNWFTLRPRYIDGNNVIQVAVYPGSIYLRETASGTTTTLDSDTGLTSTQDTWYNLRIEADGSDVTVWRWADGELESKVLETSSATISTTSSVMIGCRPNFPVDFDEIRILSDDLSNTTTFAVNNANELTSMTDYNGSTSFGFDAWGRMTSKARGSYAATYGYRYGQMLRSVTSDFPGEGDVTYEYGGDGARRERTTGSVSRHYNWTAGGTVLSEEDDSGNLLTTYVNRTLGDVSGTSPGSGTWQYHASNDIGSASSLWSSGKALLAIYASSSESVGHLGLWQVSEGVK